MASIYPGQFSYQEIVNRNCSDSAGAYGLGHRAGTMDRVARGKNLIHAGGSSKGINLRSISLGDLQSFAAAKEAQVRLFTDCKNNCFSLNAFLCTRYAARRTCFPAAMAGQASS
jgi:hypothetical protein